MTSNANLRDDCDFPAFASVNGAAGAGVESGDSMCDWLPNVMQDYSSNQTTTTAAATASNFVTTIVPSSHDYTASATPTSATVQQSPYSHQPEFVSEPSSTYPNTSAFSSSEDVYMNSFPGLSHTISSDNTVSRHTTTSPSTSSHQLSPDNFINYKKDFRLDQSPFHSGANCFGGLIQSASAGSGADHVTSHAYADPFGLDHFIDWGFDINNALDAAFITQAPAYPALSVATGNGGVAAPSIVSSEGQPQAVNADLNVIRICEATNNENISSTEKQTTSPSSTSSSASTTSTTTPRTAKRSSNTTTTTDTTTAATQSSKRRRTVMTSASPTTSLKSSNSSTADNSLNDPSAASSTIIVSAAEKRRRNTLAARRCRQRQLDRVAALESALEKALREKDDAKVEIARLKGENEVLRSLIGGKK